MTELLIGYRFQNIDSNGSILAATGGDSVALEALRISALRRARESGSLVAWLPGWIPG